VTMWVLTQADLFRKMNKVVFTVTSVCAGTRLKKSANGREVKGLGDFGIIRDIASNDLGNHSLRVARTRRRMIPGDLCTVVPLLQLYL
jgi:hypothetical protein